MLPNGKVLIGGGYNGSYLGTSEPYDPATGTWTPTGSLVGARASDTATVLPDGRVLEAGGFDGTTVVSSAELYDPGTMTEATTVKGNGFVPAGGGIAKFTLRATQSANRPSGSLTFNDTGTGTAFRNGKVRTLTFNGNSATLTGNARLGDGSKVTYNVTVTDGSSNGSSDTFNLTLSNGYSAGGTVTNGDISIQ